MPNQMHLSPTDIPVALQLAIEPGAKLEAIQHSLGISLSTVHQALRRLQAAGIVRADARKVNRQALLEFLEHGIRYAFPGQLGDPGAAVRGVPTAHAGPDLADEIVADRPVVWPSPDGPAVGQPLTPLFPKATQLPERSAPVYALLTLVDALRVGRVRERQLAAERLRARLRPAASTVAEASMADAR